MRCPANFVQMSSASFVPASFAPTNESAEGSTMPTPLSPSSLANRPRAGEEPVALAKRAKVSEAAPSSSTLAAVASSSSSPAAAPRGLSALSQVDTSWQLQLHVRCEQSIEPSMENKINYNGETYCSRDFIVSGNSSAFDLVKAVLCAFGISSVGYNHANGQGKLGATSVWVKDVLATSASPEDTSAFGPIAGLSAKAAFATVSEARDMGGCKVSASDLKKAKLAQLLDKPWFDTPARSSTDGCRSRLALIVHVPARVAHVSRVTGGMMMPVEYGVYAFTVVCVAVGNKHAMESSLQRLLPRCVAGRGQAHRGSKIEWQLGDEDDGVDCLELDELNVKFVNGRAVPGADCEEEDDPYAIVDLLRQPLYIIEDAGGSSGQLHLDGNGRGRAERAW